MKIKFDTREITPATDFSDLHLKKYRFNMPGLSTPDKMLKECPDLIDAISKVDATKENLEYLVTEDHKVLNLKNGDFLIIPHADHKGFSSLQHSNQTGYFILPKESLDEFSMFDTAAKTAVQADYIKKQLSHRFFLGCMSDVSKMAKITAHLPNAMPACAHPCLANLPAITRLDVEQELLAFGHSQTADLWQHDQTLINESKAEKARIENLGFGTQREKLMLLSLLKWSIDHRRDSHPLAIEKALSLLHRNLEAAIKLESQKH